MKNNILASLLFVILLSSCQNQKKINIISAEDSLRIVNEIISHRNEQVDFFLNSPQSPFNRDTTISYEGIKYFDPDLDYYFQSKLYRYEKPETVIVLGTKGEEREQLIYGYFLLNYKGTEHNINVYKYTKKDIRRYEQLKNHLSVWFRDSTTGKETYSVGRYVEVEIENDDKEFVYTIDLNKSYNPYCAYSPLYSCAIPREEDFLNFAVKAGEKKYH